MTKIIIIGLLVLAVIVLAVWALILMARKDLLDRMEVRIEEKEERNSLKRNAPPLKTGRRKSRRGRGKS